jgi:2,5-dihydroxypyridine 5,6-dioxygenase
MATLETPPGAAGVGPEGLGAALKDLFREHLELCKLRSDETLALTYTPDSRPEYVVAARLAAAEIGARLVELPVPLATSIRPASVMHGMGGTQVLDAAHVDAIKRADMLLDLTAEGLLWTPLLGEILEAGTRTVMAIDPPEALQRMFPTPEHRARVERNAERLGRARSLRVTSAAGSDFRCRLGQYAARARYGYSDEPGHWDHWPSGMVATFPDDDSAEGVLVADVGDVPLPFMRYLESPVRFVFERGGLVAIEGGFDARLIREFIESWNDPDGFLVSHLGWGLQPKASWAAIALFGGERMLCQDIRTFEGNFLFSTGPNEPAGRFTPCHFDLACRDNTLYLDDELIVDRGVLAPDYRSG